MAAYRIVHYLNMFFRRYRREKDKADYEPEVQEKVIGPGLALAQGLGDDYEIVATVICGDNYFGENLDEATDTIVEMVKRYHPDVFVAGPAFNAGTLWSSMAEQYARQWKKDLAFRLCPVCIRKIREQICSVRM